MHGAASSLAPLLACCVASVCAVHIIDFATPLTASIASCFVKKGVTQGIVRAWHSYGGPDVNAPASLLTMQRAGFNLTDVYMFPCTTTTNASLTPAKQFTSMLSYLSSKSAQYRMVWLDVETNPSTHCGWSATDLKGNCAFMDQLVKAGQQQVGPARLGIYSSTYMWHLLMGQDCTVGQSAPLWYAHYDQVQNFQDFKPFGGWTHPYAKQFWDHDTAPLCGLDVDQSWRP